ncbi:hypothetical protein KUTeg_001343 [Tegillarca granosa]|uniref:Uncharacterized protein n=1 Tax=Tegillarca granosa TaxID=220873 RepID=A0ABQ9FSN7_TEGGR|nr:hypothetical protein KUTeg_001343 [Tegillarca granosa]
MGCQYRYLIGSFITTVHRSTSMSGLTTISHSYFPPLPSATKMHSSKRLTSTLATEYQWYRLIESMYNGSSNDFVSDKLKQLNARVDHGLKLLLNVEQYEYMPGPNDAAGIKVLPHDHGEFPRVRELGISIPTGSHAFVGLRVLQIENLRYPYGQCREKKLEYFNSYSYDSCQIECLTNEINARCGCRDFYMPHSSENLSQNTIRKKCDCPTPCSYYLYDPVLSYGGTTTHAAEKLLDILILDD